MARAGGSEEGALVAVIADEDTITGFLLAGVGDVDLRKRTIGVHEAGVAFVEDQLGIENLYEAANSPLVSYLNNAVKAKELFNLDKDYIVRDGEVIIIDEFTGRVLVGRRYNEGLHQAIEAKEKVEIKAENQTLATITLQNYFRLYDKLAGMTGTADTEAEEFHKIYKLDVTVIPTNRPLLRPDFPDVVYKTEKEKFNAVIEEIKELYAKGQPILVGTISIEKSEVLSEMLKRFGVPHNVLNAKQHDREAEIVAQAGRKGAITIATNMAGRGTDIVLGGNPDGMAKQWLRSNPEATEEEYEAVLAKFKAQCGREHEEVVKLGGLHILGTERHESRRIDNQLRGRSGRQGDPGSSRFYLSLQDDLLRIFGSDRVAKIMEMLKIEEGEAITHGMISRAIENAQKKVEAHNFDIRKHLIDYDDVMNKQREVIYTQRKEILAGTDPRGNFLEMMENAVEDIAETYAVEKIHSTDWDWDGITGKSSKKLLETNVE